MSFLFEPEDANAWAADEFAADDQVALAAPPPEPKSIAVPAWAAAFADAYTARAIATGLWRPEVYCVIKKTIIRPSEMTAKQQKIYEELQRDAHFEENVIWMKTQTIASLIGAPAGHRVSGRVVDSLMTKYPRAEDVHYYIDVTDRPHTRYVSRERFWRERDPARQYVLFNISSAYRSHMLLYAKTFFDPFGRGVEVLHRTANGQFLTFSMCKLIFYIWARQNHVFDFLKDKYENIARVQRDDQQRQREYRQHKRRMAAMGVRSHKPKRKFRHVVGTLCTQAAPRFVVPAKLVQANVAKKDAPVE